MQRALGLLFDLDETERRKQVNEGTPVEQPQPNHARTCRHGVPDRSRLPGIAGENGDPPTRPQHPHHLASDAERIRHQVERPEAADGVERFIAKRQCSGVAAHVADSRSAVVGHGSGQHRLGNVEADGESSWRHLPRQRTGEVAGTARDIKQSVGLRQTQSRRRALLFGASRNAAGNVERGRPPQPLIHGCHERAVHRPLGKRRRRRLSRFTQDVEISVPHRGGPVEEAAGQLKRVVAAVH